MGKLFAGYSADASPSDTDYVAAIDTETGVNKKILLSVLRTLLLKVSTIWDTNGNEAIRVVATASAINDITVTNAAIGTSPQITATGDDTNIGLIIKAKGTGTVQLGRPVAFRAYNSVATTLTDASIVQIAFATEVYDYGGNFASSAFTAPYTGIYHFDTSVTIDSAVSTPVDMQIYLYVDGAAHSIGGRFTTGSDYGMNMGADINLTAGQVVTVRFYQNSAGNEATVASNLYTWFTGFLVGRTD